MSLDRKDIRAKLDPDMHAKLKAICDVDEIDMGDFIEQCLVPVIKKRVHDASVLAAKLQRLGMAGSENTAPGTSGSGRS